MFNKNNLKRSFRTEMEIQVEEFIRQLRHQINNQDLEPNSRSEDQRFVRVAHSNDFMIGKQYLFADNLEYSGYARNNAIVKGTLSKRNEKLVIDVDITPHPKNKKRIVSNLFAIFISSLPYLIFCFKGTLLESTIIMLIIGLIIIYSFDKQFKLNKNAVERMTKDLKKEFDLIKLKSLNKT